MHCGRQVLQTEQPDSSCPECRALTSEPAAQPAARHGRLALERMPVTTGIITVNALVFAAMILSGVSVSVPQIPQLIHWGANFGPRTLTSEPWRLLTSNYVHIGILHIALNMWCLWNLGALAERIFDRWTYFLTYTACGISGSVTSLWWHRLGVGAGASGAIFGLAGALISALYFGRLPIPRRALQSTLKSLISFAGYNLFFGTVIPGIDNSAHLGGLLSGLILGTVLARHLASPADERNAWRRWVFVATGLVLALAFHFLRHLAQATFPSPSFS